MRGKQWIEEELDAHIAQVGYTEPIDLTPDSPQPRFTHHCGGCGKVKSTVQTRYTMGARFLCDECAR